MSDGRDKGVLIEIFETVGITLDVTIFGFCNQHEIVSVTWSGFRDRVNNQIRCIMCLNKGQYHVNIFEWYDLIEVDSIACQTKPLIERN